MARIVSVSAVVGVCILLSWLIEPGLAYKSDINRLRWTPDAGNAIVQTVDGYDADQAQDFSRDLGKGPSSSSPFYEEISKKLSDLESRVEELSTQNGLLRKKIEESEGQNGKLALLVAKLENVLGVQDHDIPLDEGVTGDRGEDGDVEHDEVADEKRIETISEYIGNREAELVAYNPDRVMSNDSSPIDQLREKMSPEAQKALDLLGKSLVQLSHRTDTLEADITNIQSKVLGGLSDDQLHAETINDVIGGAVPKKAPGRVGSAGPAAVQATTNVAFSAAATRPQYGTTQAQTVEFQDVMENVNGDFLSSNDTFVCSVPGWYFFTFSLRTADDMYLGVLLMKNADYLVSVYTDASVRNTMETQSAVVELKVGDAVWVRLGPSSSYGLYSDTYRYSTFSGFLVVPSQ